jgi:hypothetical protein
MRCVGSVSAEDVDTLTAAPARAIANLYPKFMMLLLVTEFSPSILSAQDIDMPVTETTANDPSLTTTNPQKP